MQRWLPIVVALAAVIDLAGCSSRPTTVVVSGTVTYEGRPLENGEIRFLPQAGTAAPTNGSRVVNGRYAVVARGGLLPGTYRVEIESRATAGNEPAMPEAGEGPPRPPVRIPVRYNSESTLEVEIGPEPREQAIDYKLTAK